MIGTFAILSVSGSLAVNVRTAVLFSTTFAEAGEVNVGGVLEKLVTVIAIASVVVSLLSSAWTMMS